MEYAIGVDLGGTRIKAVAVTRDGQVIDRMMRRTQDDTEGWTTHVRDAILEFEAQQDQPAKAIGVAAPGIASPSGKCIDWMIGRLELLQGLDFGELLNRPTPNPTPDTNANVGLPAVPVINDAQAAMMGEIWQGAAKGYENVALLTLGTGVGGALMVNGRLLRGQIGRAGHLGHVSLDPDGVKDIANTPGALEYAIGNYSIKDRTNGRYASTYELLEAYHADDKYAAEVWLKSVKALGAAIAGVINIADPAIVILAGGITQAGDALLRPLSDYLDEFEWRPHGHTVEIKIATAGEFAGAMGAAYHALRLGE